MMNKKRSPVTHISRYALAIPGVVAIALLLAVTFSRSRAQESPLSLDHLSSGEMADEFAPALVDGASPADPAIRIEPNIEQLSLSSKPDTLVIHRADSSRSGKTSFKAVIRSATDGEDSKQPMYVIDGKVVDLVDALDDIDLNSIESVTVLKDRHALELYGEAGRNGVILIATKVRTPTADLRIRRGVGPIFIPDSIQESLPSTVRGEFKVRRVADFPDSIRLRFTPEIQIDTLVSRQLVMRLHETPPYNTPFVLIDGLRGDLSELPPERIKSISVLKGDRALVDQYGPGAMWGVIKVETKE